MSDCVKDCIERNDRGEILTADIYLTYYHVSIVGVRVMISCWKNDKWSGYCNVMPVDPDDGAMTAFQLCKFLDMEFNNPNWHEVRDFIISHLDYATSLYYKGRKK